MNKNYIHIVGRKYNNGYFFKNTSKDVIEFVSLVSDYIYNRFSLGTKLDIGLVQVFDNGNYMVGGIDVVVDEFRDATEDEIKRFNEVLNENNLQVKFLESEKMPSLCWIDRNKMPMLLNDKLIKVEDFYKMQFDEDTKVTLSYDNGFSYCGTETVNIKRLYNVLDTMFNPKNEKSLSLHDCRVHNGRVYGWRFGSKGELIVNTTKKDINYSEVSNT